MESQIYLVQMGPWVRTEIRKFLLISPVILADAHMV